MKQKRIPANSIILPLVIAAVVLSVLLSFAGFISSGAIERGHLVYGLVGMALICLLGAIAIFAAVIYQRKEACRTMDYAFSAPMNHYEQSLDFTRIETPKEFTTGVFSATTMVERASANLDEVRVRNQRKLDQETEEIIRQLRNSEFFVGSLGHQPETTSCPQASTSMDFTIDMVSQVLAALQEDQAQPQSTGTDGKVPEFAVTAPEFSETTVPDFALASHEFLVTVPEFPVAVSERSGSTSLAQVEKSGYRGNHFKSDVEFLFEAEPLFTVLPTMKHARRGQPQKVEKAG